MCLIPSIFTLKRSVIVVGDFRQEAGLLKGSIGPGSLCNCNGESQSSILAEELSLFREDKDPDGNKESFEMLLESPDRRLLELFRASRNLDRK